MFRKLSRSLGLIALAALCLLAQGLAAAEPANAVITDSDMAYWLKTVTDLAYRIGPRAYATEGESQAIRYLENSFGGMGYTYQAGTLQSQTVGDSRNLIAIRPAKSPDPAILVVCAHFDTVGHGPGAKDNASGVAAMLTLCRRLSAMDAFDTTELRFIGFTAEETGHQGSMAYCASLTDDERARMIGAINIDLLAVDAGAENIVLSCNTLGGRTANGYQKGQPERPMANAVSVAFEAALKTADGFDESHRGESFIAPRHWAEGDHESFADIGVDAACVCFQGSEALNGVWPEDMHTEQDTLKDFDTERTRSALAILMAMMTALAA